MHEWNLGKLMRDCVANAKTIFLGDMESYGSIWAFSRTVKVDCLWHGFQMWWYSHQVHFLGDWGGMVIVFRIGVTTSFLQGQTVESCWIPFWVWKWFQWWSTLLIINNPYHTGVVLHLQGLCRQDFRIIMYNIYIYQLNIRIGRAKKSFDVTLSHQLLGLPIEDLTNQH